MSQPLDALRFPLWGSRLIEASAGTGKTWTIAALYLRLVLGHGAEGERFARPLQPADILVMTFTRTATRELSDRIRARLIEAAHCFRGEAEPAAHDALLRDLLADYPDTTQRERAAWQLALAAEAMDEAAIFTIDAWCQRMLREHAFDSGCLFDEELISDESDLTHTAVHDYWRQQVYTLGEAELDALLAIWPSPAKLATDARQLLALDIVPVVDAVSAGALITATQTARRSQLLALKQGWSEKAQDLLDWLNGQTERKDKPFDGRKLGKNHYTRWLETVKSWSLDSNPDGALPDLQKGWERLSPEGMHEAAKDPATMPELPAACAELAQLKAALANLPALKPALLQHAASHIAMRLAELKQRAGTFGFADMQQRLDRALAGSNGDALRQRILAQYPLAMVDEFQDTSPLQYRIFDRLYRTAEHDPATALLLIGDPKQSIYGFRGADIHSYLAARRATEGRHYALATNYRSTTALVDAVNHLFAHAEHDPTGWPQGAFGYRKATDNPLPFESVGAQGRAEKLVSGSGDTAALTLWVGAESVNKEGYRQQFAAHCAEQIVAQLNDGQAGFTRPDGGFSRLKPADIAVLVRTGTEAAAVRRALQQRGVASVYLSDKDSVFASQEAADVLRWLCAVASPLDGRLARAALATTTLDMPLDALAQLTHDDLAWEAHIEQLKTLRHVWQRQGVLTMLRQFLHAFALPARLLGKMDGERSLTNILHLAELLQSASLQQEGELALSRWLGEQIAEPGSGGDAAIVRLESDADLVKVVTIHKSKGLEYPLVYVPFAGSFRPVEKRGRSLIDYPDERGERQRDFALSDAAIQAADQARLQEDLRLFYVALTRPRHALWLGVAAITDRGRPVLQRSALGYLLSCGAEISADDLPQRLAAWQADGIVIETIAAESAHTLLQRPQAETALREPAPYRGDFERNWAMASFSAIARDLDWQASASPQAENLLAAPDEIASTQTSTAPWHRFPRGAIPGNFLHEQLEWLAGSGFTSVLESDFAERVGQRCDRLGWGHRKEDVAQWLHAIASTALPPLGVPLAAISTHLPEMEFWFPSAALHTATLDRLCRQHILPGHARPALPERKLHGLLKGYADLVFEQGGRYWVLDYKSNALGNHDGDYHADALAGAITAHRYDVQAAIYLLALHRLLRQRLGTKYDPDQHLGGALFYFLRGVNVAGAGCLQITVTGEWLAELDGAFTTQTDTCK